MQSTLVGNVRATTRPRDTVELLGSAGAAALLATTICYAAAPGINWSIWTTVVAAELFAFARPRLGANRAAFDVTIAAAIVLSWGAAVTTSDAAQALIFVTVGMLLGVAARLTAGLPAPLVGLAELARVPVAAFRDALREAMARIEAMVRAAFSDAGARILRGLAIAIPTVAIFAALLSGADPTFQSFFQAISTLFSDWSWVPRLVFFGVIGTLSLGTFGVAAGSLVSPVKTKTAESPRYVLGDTERRIVVGSVDALFACFLVLQAFSRLPANGSYTEYVHKGFAELTIVATLSVVLVAALHNGRARLGTPWGTLALLAEVELLVASALHRIVVYQRDFGYTSLRVWVSAYMLLVAGLIVLVAIDVARPRVVDARRFVRRGALLSIAVLTALVYGNPDAWVAEHELARYQTTSKIDVAYLASLSFDATPSLLRVARALPVACHDQLIGTMQRPTQPIRWFEWTARRARAERALRGVPWPAHDVTCEVARW